MSVELGQESISWQELVELTHYEQIERFGWCACDGMRDDDGESPFEDCPPLEKEGNK